MATGGLITFEGGEGAGKSTQVRLLAAALRAAGLEAVTTREPGGAPGAELIRGLLLDGPPERWDPVSEMLLHFAARREHLRATILPALARGAWVVCDRFADSTRAYQGAGLGVAAADIEAVYRIAVGTTRPDLTVILDIAPELGLARAGRRAAAADRYERMDPAFHARLREGFLAIARGEPERCVVIDAAAAVEAVAAAVRAAVRDRLGVTA